MISIIIPTIRSKNIPALLQNIKDNTSVAYETIVDNEGEGKDRIGAPRMVKKLTDTARFDWVVFLGDDTLIEPHCIDNALKQALALDLWLVGFNDGHGQKATHWLANKKLLNYLENREFFYTGYIHNFCDDELRIRAERLGKYGWCESARIIHKHPSFGTAKMDDTYKIQTDHVAWDHDERLFNERINKVDNKKNVSLGIVMIVKNESAMLATCLESVKEADAIYIADTGSMDNTIGIAESYTPNVYSDFEWNDNFADARNFILSKAKTDWVLSIDADEVLDPGGIAKIKEAIGSSDQSAIGIQMKSNKDKYYVPRLFKNTPEVKWVGSIHETINVLMRDNIDVGITYGSSPAHTFDPDRNIRIMEKSYEQDPSNVRLLYYLGREYVYRANWEKAEKVLEERVSQDGFLAEKADAYFILAFCYWYDGKGHGELARQSCLKALNINANFKAAILLMAEMSYPQNAIQWKRMAETATNEGLLFMRERWDVI